MLTLLLYSKWDILSDGSLQNKQEGSNRSLKQDVEQIKILIAESENDLLLLFSAYLSSLGIKVQTAGNGQEAIEQFLKSQINKRPYNVIMLDTHLDNLCGLDVAKKIRSEKPDQKVVLITTTPKENLQQECLRTAGIKDKDILTMPFKMSKLKIALEN
jgi:two-component system, OmpR family, response regulator